MSDERHDKSWWDRFTGHHRQDDERIERKEDEILREDQRIEHRLDEIARLDEEIVVGLSAKGIRLVQIKGDLMSTTPPAITGVAVGTTGYFRAFVIPDGSQLKPGTTFKFSTGDPSVTLAPSPDGDSSVIAASVADGEQLPSFGITVEATSLDGTALTSNNSILVLPKGSTGGTPATGIGLVQIPKPGPGTGTGGGTTPISISASPNPVALSLSPAQGSDKAALKVVDNNGNDVTSQSTFAIDQSTIASVDTAGNVQALASGSATITVTFGSLTTTVPVSVAA